MLKSRVVYNFQCAECNSVYVGYTTRHFQTRVHEHLQTDSASHVYKHLGEKDVCKAACNENNLKNY